MEERTQPSLSGRHWPVLRAFARLRPQDILPDAAAGLTLAAIAIPEQMATAKLGGFAPQAGLFAFAAGTIGFAFLGSNRSLSSGADSTITPIFAGALGALAAQSSPAYFGLASVLALSVGVMLIGAGIARLGWIASFLSIPVMTGFLAGVAIHIVASQLPPLLGLPTSGGDLLARVEMVAGQWRATNLYALLLGALVFAAMLAAERINPRIPGALIGLVLAIALVALFDLENKGVAVIGARSLQWPHFALPAASRTTLGNLVALSLIIALVVMMQTSATTRAFTSLADPQNIDRDFVGVGAGSVIAGLFGLFPVNASPPRTAAVVEAGGRTQLSGILAVAIVICLLAFGATLLQHLPLSALAGVLLAVALRIANLSRFVQIFRETPAEFALIVVTMIAIVVFPIQIGVGFGIALSVLHGIWTITRTHLVEFVHVPGTSVWWPPSGTKGETLSHVKVVAFQAPLSFLNADAFRRDMIDTVERGNLRLIVFEASGVAEIDFTASQVLLDIILRCHDANIRFAVARLTSLRAQNALKRFGIIEKLGPHGLFRTVDEAIRVLDQGSRPSSPPDHPETR